MQDRPKIILMTLGEELLLGLTRNGHLTYIGEQLRLGGAALHANITISDHPEEIAEHFKHYWESADILITTGGLGPTVDDRTKEVIAESLGEKLVFDTDIMASITERFATLGLHMTDNNRKQAYRFEHSITLANPNGTAPGLWLEKDGKVLVMLPGPPRELQPMFEQIIISKFRERGWMESDERYLQIRCIGVGESALETNLQSIFNKYPNIEVAYCAHQGQVDFRFSFPEADRYDELLQIAAECKTMLGDDFLSLGYDGLSKVVSDLLRSRGQTLATAESCTGGAIANAITDLPGSSSIFVGGIVAYSEDAKEELLGVPEELIQQHGVVSAEVAMAMAAGAADKLESEYALSTTGFAGPDGGTDEHPVGTVFVGLCSPQGVWARKLYFKTDRLAIKARALNAALDWLRRTILAAPHTVQDEASDLRADSNDILKSLG